MNDIKKDLIFELNEKEEKFQEIILLDDFEPAKLLDTNAILAFNDSERRVVWEWIGAETNIRARFIASVQIKILRDEYAFGFKILSVDEGHEPRLFKIYLGLEEPGEEESESEESIEPLYIEEDIDEFNKQKILLVLEKIAVPEGYQREFVIVKDVLYLYREVGVNHPHVKVSSKKLYLLEEKIDGNFLMNGYTPRLVFSYGKLILIELLKRE